MISRIRFEPFAPDPQREITVTPIIGDGQHGAWAVLLDGELVEGGRERTVVTLGRGDQLVGRLLEVCATLTNERPAPHRLSLRVELTGRATPIDIEHDGAPGARAAYCVLVPFTPM